MPDSFYELDGRITYEVLRSVPIARLRVEAEIVRPGRRVEMFAAELSDDSGVDLTVHLHRMPEGEWVCLDAITLPERTGVGMADTLLLDERGAIGRGVQTLLVADREPTRP